MSLKNDENADENELRTPVGNEVDSSNNADIEVTEFMWNLDEPELETKEELQLAEERVSKEILELNHITIETGAVYECMSV